MSVPMTKIPLMWAIAAATLSGTLAAFALEPVMQVVETAEIGDIPSILVPFALTVGLFFGLLGAAVARWSMGVRWPAAGALFAASMIGMAAAVYAAIMGYDNTTENFVQAYALGSPVGALILAVPFAFLGRFLHPWRTIALAAVLPTLWAMGVGVCFAGDAAIEVPGLAALYIGWQVLFLGIFATARRDQRPHMPLG